MPYKDPKRKAQFDLERRARIKAELVAHFGGACMDCGFVGPPVCFDFHHRDPSTKEFGISHKMSVASLARIYAEAEKCDMICANCHRIRHLV